MAAKAALAQIKDGNKSQLVNQTDNSVTLHTGGGRLIGYYINIALTAVLTVVKDDTVELFTIPVSLVPTGNFIPVGGEDGIEYTTALVIDNADAAVSGQIMFVWSEYTDS